MYILLEKYFCCTVFKKTDFYFDHGREYIYIFCDMRIWNAFTQMKRSWSDSQSSSCIYILTETSRVVKENAHLSSIHTEIWSRNMG